MYIYIYFFSLDDNECVSESPDFIIFQSKNMKMDCKDNYVDELIDTVNVKSNILLTTSIYNNIYIMYVSDHFIILNAKSFLNYKEF